MADCRRPESGENCVANGFVFDPYGRYDHWGGLEGVAGTALLAGVLSILESLGGLPEVKGINEKKEETKWGFICRQAIRPGISTQ